MRQVEEGECGPAMKTPAQKEKAPEASAGKCPSGHRWGKDVDQFDDCDDCKVWAECEKGS